MVLEGFNLSMRDLPARFLEFDRAASHAIPMGLLASGWFLMLASMTRCSISGERLSRRENVSVGERGDMRARVGW